jgi:hypothetical protein
LPFLPGSPGLPGQHLLPYKAIIHIISILLLRQVFRASVHAKPKDFDGSRDALGIAQGEYGRSMTDEGSFFHVIEQLLN